MTGQKRRGTQAGPASFGGLCRLALAIFGAFQLSSAAITLDLPSRNGVPAPAQTPAPSTKPSAPPAKPTQPSPKTPPQAPPATPQKGHFSIRRKTIDGAVYLDMADVATFYNFKQSQNDKKQIFSSKFSKLEFQLDSREATLNGVKLMLSFPPRLRQDRLYFSDIDFQTYLEPLLRPLAVTRRTVKKIVIDAGHGGKDPGCKGGTFEEKDINLSVALQLKAILKERGYVVELTRSKDVFLTLKERVDLAKRLKPDLFISLHCNAAGDTARGMEVFCATPNKAPASGSTVLSRKACAANAFDAQNVIAAFEIQKSLVAKMTTLSDRGIKHKRYTVIADLPAPCVLVEMGFLTNAEDRKVMTTADNQKKIAQAIANGVDKYRIRLVPPVQPRAAAR